MPEMLEMNALDQIIDELSDDGRSLAGPLLKTKVLASRIKNQEIVNWASRELEGYREVEYLPYYRYVRPVYNWIIRQRGLELPPAPVPQIVFDEETRRRFFRGRMEDAVTVLESLSKRSDGDGALHKDYGADICQFLTERIENNRQLNIRILRFTSTTDVSETVQVLAVIRSKLLDFMLRLESDVPELAKSLSEIGPVKETDQSRITQLFHQMFVIVTGDGNTVVAGDSNNVTAPDR
jgi:hypothetical protein